MCVTWWEGAEPRRRGAGPNPKQDVRLRRVVGAFTFWRSPNGSPWTINVNVSQSAYIQPTVEQRLAALERRISILQGVVEALVWAWVAAPLAAVLLFVNRPGGLVMSQVFNVGHVVLSAWVAWVGYRIAHRVMPSRGLAVHLVVAMSAVAVVGGGLELSQYIAPGEPSWRDVIIDLGGGLACVLVVAAVRGGCALRTRALLASAAIGVFVLSLAQPSLALFREVKRGRLFPTLATFAEAERDALSLNFNATLTSMDTPDDAREVFGRRARLLTLPPGKYPGIEVIPPPGDWSEYTDLHLQVYSLASEALPFEVRVHDREHARKQPPRSPADRFTRELTLRPGLNEFRFPVSEIQRTPSGRMMNLTEIEQIVLFTPSPGEPVQVLLGPWKLTGNDG